MGFSGEEPFYGEKGRRGFDRLCQCINSQTVCLSCIAISKTMNYNISNRRCNQMKDSTVSARVENDIKNEAEDILQKLGVPVSVVINSLYRQIIYHHGIPFSLLTQNFSTAMLNRLQVKADRSGTCSMIWKGALDK